ncbi:MAG: Maf family protein [Bifidobacteriaceae bacterium]|jgi:septum formation protein|nr:Maf family protein [Bifidobacteriaceae bacterium]
MKNYKVILASKSIGRFKTLKSAGITPYVLSPELDESLIIKKTAKGRRLNTKKAVQILAKAKGEEAVKMLNSKISNDEISNVNGEMSNVNGEISNAKILLAGDSLFEFHHKVFGKPKNYEIAKKRLKAMSGKTGNLFSAIYIYNIKSKTEALIVDQAKVTISSLDDEDIENYLSTGEPYLVAGGFTIDGLGGPFIKKVNGDPHTVIGMPLPALRLALKKMNIEWFEILDKVQNIG